VNSARVLILHGSPGSGKTTLARAISELLSSNGVTNGVIDVDELNLVFPAPMRNFWLTNLATIWPNYARVADIHVVIPTVVADAVVDAAREVLLAVGWTDGPPSKLEAGPRFSA
jgi:chloramphenicol 3-O-phosphotransferase